VAVQTYIMFRQNGGRKITSNILLSRSCLGVVVVVWLKSREEAGRAGRA